MTQMLAIILSGEDAGTMVKFKHKKKDSSIFMIRISKHVDAKLVQGYVDYKQTSKASVPWKEVRKELRCRG